MNSTFKNQIIFLLLASLYFTSCNERTPIAQPREQLASPHSSTQNEKLVLLNLERESIQKEFQNDTAFLSSVMDSTFIELSKDSLKNKHEVLKTIFKNNSYNKKSNIVQDSFVLENPVVNLYNNTAVVTFIMRTYNRKKDSSFQRRTRFYDVWVKRGKQWKAITWQASSVD